MVWCYQSTYTCFSCYPPSHFYLMVFTGFHATKYISRSCRWNQGAACICCNTTPCIYPILSYPMLSWWLESRKVHFPIQNELDFSECGPWLNYFWLFSFFDFIMALSWPSQKKFCTYLLMPCCLKMDLIDLGFFIWEIKWVIVIVKIIKDRIGWQAYWQWRLGVRSERRNGVSIWWWEETALCRRQ